MKKGIKRIGKGLFAIFIMKLILLCGALVFHACQSENDFSNEINEEAKNNFLDALKITGTELSNVSISPSITKLPLEKRDAAKRDGTTTNSTTNVDTQTFCLTHYNANSTDQALQDIVANITSLGDLMNARSQHGVSTQFDLTYSPSNTTNTGNSQHPNSFDPNDCLSIFELPVQPVIDAMTPAIIEAKNFLYSKQMTDTEIIEVLDGEEEYNLVPLVTALIAAESNSSNSNVSREALSLFIESTYAQDTDIFSERLYDCGMRALGITALQDLIQKGYKSNAGKKALKKAIRKIAAKTLNWIGIAWAMFEFTTCMFF
ncbi:MAG: hypothetical protein AAF611_03500 [Bacteroidota bacterium]